MPPLGDLMLERRDLLVLGDIDIGRCGLPSGPQQPQPVPPLSVRCWVIPLLFRTNAPRS